MKEQLDYFRDNIFEAKSVYNGWKMIVYSKWVAYVGQDLAEKYVKIQSYHKDFFYLAERSFLFHWVLLVLHCFDPRKDSFSLRKIARQETELFLKESQNKKIFSNLKIVRDTLLAHRSKAIKKRDIGSMEELDLFFKNIEDFYNKILDNLGKSKVMFQRTDDIKYDIEDLFMNIEGGELARKNKLDGDWSLKGNLNRISNIL
ncbi:MAG: hypothetical protein AAB394_03810 [Patescibacteria group bacterium]